MFDILNEKLKKILDDKEPQISEKVEIFDEENLEKYLEQTNQKLKKLIDEVKFEESEKVKKINLNF